MKKQFNKIWVCLAVVLASFTMPAMATDVVEDYDIFKLETQEMIKVAPRSKFEHCKRFPRPGCPGYKDPDATLNEKSGESDKGIFYLLKLKCKKAKTCLLPDLDNVA